jgi:hypothetical protein
MRLLVLMVALFAGCSKECPPYPKTECSPASISGGLPPTWGEMQQRRGKRMMSNPYDPNIDPQIAFTQKTNDALKARGERVYLIPDEHNTLSMRFDNDDAPDCSESELRRVIPIIGAASIKAAKFARVACNDNAAQIAVP